MSQTDAQQYYRLYNALRLAISRCTREDRKLDLTLAMQEARTQYYLCSLPLPSLGGAR